MRKSESEMDIVETAKHAGAFGTLLTAVGEAGLAKTLKGKGPFTVFAPTDAAFEKIPKDVLSAVLKDKRRLTQILTYHVVAGKVMSKDAKGCAKTIEGHEICFHGGRNMKVEDAVIVQKDIECSNGVIHVIDSVLMPN